MKMSTFQQRLFGYYKTGKCYTIKSKPGRGKTSVIKKAPKVLSAMLGKRIGYSYINAANLPLNDVTGYLLPGKDTAGNLTSGYTRPFWWYTEEGLPLEAYDGGILFIDEEDKADIDVKKVIGELGMSRHVGPHRLPPGWVVWMAGNRRKDRSGSTRELDHLINRRCEIEIELDFPAFEAFAMEAGLPTIALSFAKTHPQIVLDSDMPERQGPWCTPRSFVEGVEHIQAFADVSGKLPTDFAAQEEMAGFVGKDAAREFFQHMKLEDQLPDLDELLLHPATTPVPTAPDVQYLITLSLAYRAEVHNVDAMGTFIGRLPKEFHILFYTTALKRNAELMDADIVIKNAEENQALMSAIRKYRIAA